VRFKIALCIFVLIALCAPAIGQTTAKSWIEKGDDLFVNQSKYSEAINAYDKAIELDPQNADVWYSKGYALDYLDKYNESIEAYDRAIEINPKNEGAWNNKGFTLTQQGKFDEAIKTYDEAISINPLNWYRWDAEAQVQKKIGIEQNCFLRDFYTTIDGRGVTVVISFVDKKTGGYVKPEGKLLLILYRYGTSEIFAHVYTIKKEDYNSYLIIGTAIRKWISFEDMPASAAKSKNVIGRICFQDAKGVITIAKEEK